MVVQGAADDGVQLRQAREGGQIVMALGGRREGEVFDELQEIGADRFEALHGVPHGFPGSCHRFRSTGFVAHER